MCAGPGGCGEGVGRCVLVRGEVWSVWGDNQIKIVKQRYVNLYKGAYKAAGMHTKILCVNGQFLSFTLQCQHHRALLPAH